jgi:hypothetical protein
MEYMGSTGDYLLGTVELSGETRAGWSRCVNAKMTPLTGLDGFLHRWNRIHWIGSGDQVSARKQEAYAIFCGTLFLEPEKHYDYILPCLYANRLPQSTAFQQ